MPTKTDRILSYLPGTFRPTGRSAVRAFVDAPGAELQLAEGQLAAVLQAHWVDFADRYGAVVDDLARIGSMYGLAPREDETVEEYRRHLKRFVRTYLEGTVTVQGILRVTAEALGLDIADGYGELDTWWARRDDALATVEADAADAAPLVLGVASADNRGTAARRAEIAGAPDLHAGVDLRRDHLLYVALDDGVPVEVDLSGGAADASAVSLAHIVERLRSALGDPAVRVDGGRVTLASPTIGPDSQVVVRGGAHDAATAVLGLLPLHHSGLDATTARVVGTVDLGAGVDLTEARYLRLLVDGVTLVEVDCAGPDPAHTFLDQIRDAINAALHLPAPVAAHDGRHLILTSPVVGSRGSIAIEPAAAQDAAQRLLGPVASFTVGEDARPAEVLGTVDLRGGADLRGASLLRLRIDDLATATVDCAGAIPSHTALAEVVAAINAGVGADVASAAAGRLRLRSPSTGHLAEIAIDPLVEDASAALLGIPPRLAAGAAATVARLVGTTDLRSGANLAGQHLLELAVDGRPPVRVDLRAGAPGTAGGGSVPVEALAGTINAFLGDDVATDDGEHLILRSQRAGGGSRIQVLPVTTLRRRRFVTRAFVTGEASRALLGVDVAVARGDGASQASVTGSPDLSRGVNLAATPYLRLAVDGSAAVDIACAGPRPRATLLAEVVERVNTSLSAAAGHAVVVASSDGRRLTLTSPTSGGGSRIAFEAPRAQDARPMLMGDGPAAATGRNATGVAFVGVADLRAGVDLPAHAMVRIGIGASAPVDVALTGEAGAHRSLGALTAGLNVVLGADVARTDGVHLALVSPAAPASRLVIEAPVTAGAADVTSALFGIAAPRSYRGAAATPARLVGAVGLPAQLDLSERRFLAVTVDGRPEVVLDTAPPGDAAKAVAPADVAAAVDRALGAHVASIEDGRLVLRSVHTGSTATVSVAPYGAGDARAGLFGPDVPADVVGQAARPAVLNGTVDLLTPADLSRRSGLRIAVDGGAPVDVDVAGESPGQTGLGEIVAAIDAALPGVAVATEDTRLRLVSPTAGPESRIEVLPLRSLEVVEYPSAPAGTGPRLLRHGDWLGLTHTGVGRADVALTIRAPHGTAGVALLDVDRGSLVQLLRPLSPTETARVWRTPAGALRAEVTGRDGRPAPVPATDLRGGPPGAWAQVPYPGPRPVPAAGLQLDDPTVPDIDLVVARRPDVTVAVTEAAIPAQTIDPGLADGTTVEVTGRLRLVKGGWRLEAASGEVVTDVLAGAGVTFADHGGAVVTVSGPRHHGEPPYVLVTALSRRFDVVVKGRGDGGTVRTERYDGVAIGGDAGGAGLASRTLSGADPSQLIAVRPFLAGDALRLDAGRSRWLLLECAGSRFGGAAIGDAPAFDGGATFATSPDLGATFAGGTCVWPGVFDAGAFSRPGDPATSVFADADTEFLPVEVTADWDRAQPGAFEVNLPADLDARFGARFDHAVFASAPAEPESYPGVVIEPPDADDSLITRVGSHSVLVRAEVVAKLPIGWSAVTLPFRRPQYLRGGRGSRSARLYIEEEGADGFVLIEAILEDVAVGNAVKVAARPAGPARFDVTVAIDGGRFESARAIVAGAEPAPLDRATPEALPGGIVQAKAAGIRARVTRDHTNETNGATHG